MDEENSTTFDGVTFAVEDNSTLGNDLSITGTGGAVLTAAQRSFWGTRNRSLSFQNTDVLTNSVNLDGNFTVSMWLKPLEANYNTTFRARGLAVEISNTNLTWGFTAPTISGFITDTSWSHIAVKYNQDTGLMHYYVNGEVDDVNGESFTHTSSSFVFDAGTNNILIDEVMLYRRTLLETEIGYLAGNTYLDISGNKFNAVARGAGFEMDSVAIDNNVIANSFSRTSEMHYLLTVHLITWIFRYMPVIFPLLMVEFIFWINPNGGSGPIFSASQKDENQSFCCLSLNPICSWNIRFLRTRHLQLIFLQKEARTH